MAQSRKCFVWVCVVCSWILNSCTTDVRLGHEILHIEGVTWACNISTTYVLFGSAYESDEQWEVRIPVSDGDLLYMWDDKNMELYYRYNVKDGNHLEVSHDTLKPDRVYVNGVLGQIQVMDENSCKQLADELSISRADNRTPLLICDTVTGEMLRELKESQEKLAGCGIAVEADIAAEFFNELITICRPGWMVSDTLPFDLDKDRITVLENLELLWITGDFSKFFKHHQYFGNLESLIIAGWDPGEDESVPLFGLKKLHTLTLAECSMTDLSNFEFPRRLQRLHMVACEEFTDISVISTIPHLNSLGLAGSGDAVSVKPITQLERLKRISFPVNTSQKDFESVVDPLQFLEVVELLDCPEVMDLSPLKEKGNLKILILQSDTIWPEHIESLTQLELIILSKDIFEESSELISELRSQLPDTRIVPGSGLCLGSGWLLLILPLVIVGRLLFKRR